ncbi:Hypothetical protein PHPALM_36374 [Phytophthora palmivora]|uniref:Uncharacterized protein n=1 Tax=Phytophthora palmivora TaxID=4796 RepID=A0A2P4X050_9STRA|nr:Hypothetical protein PHPALM_36374 [Phytophthora palmivora]
MFEGDDGMMLFLCVLYKHYLTIRCLDAPCEFA